MVDRRSIDRSKHCMSCVGGNDFLMDGPLTLQPTRTVTLLKSMTFPGYPDNHKAPSLRELLMCAPTHLPAQWCTLVVSWVNSCTFAPAGQLAHCIRLVLDYQMPADY